MNSSAINITTSSFNGTSNAPQVVNVGSNQQGNSSCSSTWINKLKIIGRGQNWAVAPCEPFYLMGTEPPAPDAALTGAKNLIEHYGLENSYQKFCGKKLREELSAFLPHLSGNIDVPASVDGSGLMNLIEKPPIRGKELRVFAPNQLDLAFRLHPGPLPQEYSSLFSASTSNSLSKHGGGSQQPLTVSTTSNTTSRIPATATPDLSSSATSNNCVRRKRRYEIHRGSSNPSGTGMNSNLSPSLSTTTTTATSNLSSGPISSSFFTTPPSANSQMNSSHSIMVTTSNNSTVPHTLYIPPSNSTVNMLSADLPASGGLMSHSSKSLDMPPGLIPVTAPSVPVISVTSTTQPPPPLLAPIHPLSAAHLPAHHSHSRLLLNSVQNNNSNNGMNSATDMFGAQGICTSSSFGGSKQNIPAPPLLHSINSTSASGNANNTSNYYSTNIYPGGRARSPTPPNSLGQGSSPSSPDLYRLTTHSDLVEEEKHRKKKREKKRRKDKDIFNTTSATNFLSKL